MYKFIVCLLLISTSVLAADVENIPASAVGANPTATGSNAAVNGAATTFMRSDAAPAIQKGSNSQFGVTECDNVLIDCTTVAGVVAMKNTGTAGQALVSQGASAPLYKSGVPVLLNTLTASNSVTISDTTSITATFNDYELFFENVIPATAATNLELQLFISGVAQTTSYLGQAEAIANGVAAFAQPTTFIQVGGNTTNSQPGVSGKCTIYGANTASVTKQVVCQTTSVNGSGQAVLLISSGSYTATTGPVTGVQFLETSGNITSGSVKIYGIL